MNFGGCFCYRRTVAFADTDAMGVVHHANYLRYFEEARVAWLVERGLAQTHYPHADLCLAVLESECRHFLPLRFGEEFEVYLQGRKGRLKIELQYVIVRSPARDRPVAVGRTLLVPVNSRLQIVRPPAALERQMEKETWTETWL